MKTLSKRAVALAGLVYLLTAPAFAQSKKIWICQASCIGFSQQQGFVSFFGGIVGQGKFRLDAYLELSAICQDVSRRAGLAETTLATEVQFRSLHETESTSVGENVASGAAWARTVETPFRRTFDTYATAVVAERSYRVFRSTNDFELRVSTAAMTDATVCSLEVVDINWVPPYYGPGNPQG